MPVFFSRSWREPVPNQVCRQTTGAEVIDEEQAQAVAEHEALDAHRGAEGDRRVVARLSERCPVSVELGEELGVRPPARGRGER
jgi:hypothetical protein